MKVSKKLEDLTAYFKAMGSAAVAFSGGVDSTLLLRVAKEALGDRVIAITAYAGFMPPRELEEAKSFCAGLGVEHKIIHFDIEELPEFKHNPPDRCYFCKKYIFSRLKHLAEEKGLAYVVEGSNLDDLGDYRPGLKAVRELEIKSPFLEVGFSKQDIRIASQQLGLAAWNKPSMACLASRFPYGQVITMEGLARVNLAEEFLFGLGFSQVRVRVQNDTARIELLVEEMFKALELREQLCVYLKSLGFSYVTLDLRGYRSGSMNEFLSKE